MQKSEMTAKAKKQARSYDAKAHLCRADTEGRGRRGFLCVGGSEAELQGYHSGGFL
jgi:hypothetical protein